MNTQAFMSYTDAIKTLKDSPMFNLSLSSKELFHSNFLYWIWKVDEVTFKRIIETLLGESNLDWGNDWVVSREYKNFDLCVKDRSNEDLENDDSQGLAKKPKIYFVLENKVKSIPYKAQLDKYVKKVDEHHGKKMKVDTKYLLLALPSGFPDEKVIEDDKTWKIASYENYLNAINNLSMPSDYESQIVKDYCNFVGSLLTVYDTWNNHCYQPQSPLLNNPPYIAGAEELRIHDLYHKSKYSIICANLQQKIIDSDISGKVDIVENDDKKIFETFDDPNNRNKKLIAFGYGYSNGQPFVEVKVALRDGNNPPIIYIIQAQGDAYRHGVVMNHNKLSGYNGTKDKRIWDYLGKNHVTPPQGGNIIYVNGYEWMRFENFSNNNTGGTDSLVIADNGKDVVDADCLFPDCKKRKDSQPYGKYAGDNSPIGMIYQYRKLKDKVKVSDFIDYVITDVKRLIP